jgi:hypothetical protein
MIEYLLAVHESQRAHSMMRRAEEEVLAGRGPLEDHGSAGGASNYDEGPATEDRSNDRPRCAG